MEYIATCRVVQPQNTWWVCPRRSLAKCCPSQGRGSGSWMCYIKNKCLPLIFPQKTKKQTNIKCSWDGLECRFWVGFHRVWFQGFQRWNSALKMLSLFWAISLASLTLNSVQATVRKNQFLTVEKHCGLCLIRKGKCHSSCLSFPQPEMMSRRHDKEMTPLAPFGESNLVFSLSSICSLQYMFLSISLGGLGRQKGCYPDLSLFKQGTASCKRTHMGCLS